MCGIVGYIGKRNITDILIRGLERLEYRGYDSAGIALFDKTDSKVFKKKGKVEELQKIIPKNQKEFLSGIGHTRWATHGEPSDLNSHPHVSNSGDLTLVHNGIIENYSVLKTELLKRGYSFVTETDTEVLVNFIEEIKKTENTSLEDAVRIALNQVVGAYAILIVEKKNPDKIVVARMGSPIAIGIGKNEYFLASDASPFVEYTQKVLYLEEKQMAIVDKNVPLSIRSIENDDEIEPEIQKIQLSLENIEKGGYEHFMLKEIFEQPKAIMDTLRGRVLEKEGIINISSISNFSERWKNASRILIVSCGTSWHSGLVAEYLIEELARIPVEVEYASEFRYRNPIITETDIVIGISQSGETADTLAALQLAKSKGALVYGICNVVGSSIARISDTGAYTHAGPEIGVASSKAFTAQLTILSIIALKLASIKGLIGRTSLKHYISELFAIPKKIEEMLKIEKTVMKIAEEYHTASNFLYLGRGYNFPIALEGALKLKEISYIHAEGYPAAEMKHGPIALIDENMPVVVIATRSHQYEKMRSNIQEIRARKGRIISIVSEEDKDLEKLSEHTILIPDTLECFSPMLSVVPLQLLSYHIAKKRGANVDQPRNLAKSVTVE